MGACHSVSSAGSQLLAATACGNTEIARQLLEQHPSAACYSTYVDRNSPLLVAAGCGHVRLVQAIVEAAVVAQGPARAKQRCINHTNHKGHSALILACMNGHAQCVEALVCNGASPLVLDNSRHNTALHWAASACRSECVQRLLGSSATFRIQSGEVLPIPEIPCYDEDKVTLVKFVDRHNGWGLTALHLAAFKGSTSTVRALLRNGASLSVPTVAASTGTCPVSAAVGSTALHLAAANEDMAMIRLLLEAQVSQNTADLRRVTNSQGQRPLELARDANNMLLLHVLDPYQPLSVVTAPNQGLVLYRNGVPPHTSLGFGGNLSGIDGFQGFGNGDVTNTAASVTIGMAAGAAASGGGLHNGVPIWMLMRSGTTGLSSRGWGSAGSSGRRGGHFSRSDHPPHVVLGTLLQRLRLVLYLEIVDLQNKLAAVAAVSSAATAAVGTGKVCVAARLREKQRRDKQWVVGLQQQQQLGNNGGAAAAAAATFNLEAGYVSSGSACAGADELDRIRSAADVPAAAAAAAYTAAAYGSSVTTSSSSSSDDDDACSSLTAVNERDSMHMATQQCADGEGSGSGCVGREIISSKAAAAAAGAKSSQHQELRRQALKYAQQQLQQQAQQRQAAAEAAALNERLKTMQELLLSVQEMLAALPASARHPHVQGSNNNNNSNNINHANGGGVGGTAGDPVRNSSSTSRRRNSSGSSGGGSSSSRGWGLLSRLSSSNGVGRRHVDAEVTARSSSSSGAAEGLRWQQQRDQELPSAAAAAADDEAVEQVLSAFITPGMLSSLAAAKKLLVNASALSGKQQQQQGTYSSSTAAAAADAVHGRRAAASTAAHQDLRVATDIGRGSINDNSTADFMCLHNNSSTGRMVQNADLDNQGLATTSRDATTAAFNPDRSSAVADARWAEQAHALMLVKNILQSVSASLSASQQAMSVAASRAALRQRQQEQLAVLLASERRSASLPSRRIRPRIPGHLTSSRDRDLHTLSSSSSGSRHGVQRSGSSSRDRENLHTSRSSSSVRRQSRMAASSGSNSATTAVGSGISGSRSEPRSVFASWSGGMGLGLRLGLSHHQQHRTAAAAAAAGTTSDSLFRSPLTRREGGLGPFGTSSSSSSNGSRSSSRRHVHRELHHGRHRGSRRQRGMLMSLPDPLSPHTALGSSAAAAAVAVAAAAAPQGLHSSSSSSGRHHRRQRQRHQQIDGVGAGLLLTNPTAAAAAGPAAAAAAAATEYASLRQQPDRAAVAPITQQQQQLIEESDRHRRQQQHMRRLHATLTRPAGAGSSVLRSLPGGPASAGTSSAVTAVDEVFAGTMGAQPPQQHAVVRGSNSSSSLATVSAVAADDGFVDTMGVQQQHALVRGSSSSVGSGSASVEESRSEHASDGSSSDASDTGDDIHRPGRSSFAVAPADVAASTAQHAVALHTSQVEVHGEQPHVHGEIHSAGSDSAPGTSQAPTAPSTCSSLDATSCAICMDSRAALSVSGCSHTMCLQCAYQLCCKAKELPLCPFCRQPIAGFEAAADAAVA